MQYDKENRQITVSQNTGVTLSVALIIMFAGAIMTATTTFNRIDTRGKQNAETTTDLRERVTKLEAESNESQVKFTEIQTQLKSIDANLLEIKEKLK